MTLYCSKVSTNSNSALLTGSFPLPEKTFHDTKCHFNLSPTSSPTGTSNSLVEIRFLGNLTFSMIALFACTSQPCKLCKS